MQRTQQQRRARQLQLQLRPRVVDAQPHYFLCVAIQWLAVEYRCRACCRCATPAMCAALQYLESDFDMSMLIDPDRAQQQCDTCRNSVARREMPKADGSGVAAARYCATPSQKAKAASTAAITHRPAPLLSITRR